MNIKVRLVAIVIGVIIAMVASKNRSNRRAEREERYEKAGVTDPGNDPRFKAAEAEARRRWPEFVAAFNKREPAAAYAVKAKFTEGDNVEWMWVQVDAISGATVRGILDNEPVDVHNVKVGQRVTVAQGDIDDWIIAKSGGIVKGGFTTKVMEQIDAERKRR
jgi:uncharacterized protein YegJ (DUF2314 family)